jgi:hypothetical protein
VPIICSFNLGNGMMEDFAGTRAEGDLVFTQLEKGAPYG